MLGSIFYVAPEVIQRSYNYKCDLWSLGVVMFTVITGRFPFDHKNDNSKIAEKILLEPLRLNRNEIKDSSKDLLCLVV